MRRHRSRIAIRFSDLDSFGVVNHARYLTYCEESRSDFFALMHERSGSHLLSSGVTVAHIECDYHRPLRLDVRSVTVSCWVESLGRSSFDLAYEIRAGRVLAALARATLVATGPKGGSRTLTRPERAFLDSYLTPRAVRASAQ